MKTIKEKVAEILEANAFSIHPSRLEDYQNREAIRLLAEELDNLIKFVYEE